MGSFFCYGGVAHASTEQRKESGAGSRQRPRVYVACWADQKKKKTFVFSHLHSRRNVVHLLPSLIVYVPVVFSRPCFDVIILTSISGHRLYPNSHLNVIIQFEASRRGKKMSNSSREKNEGTYRSGNGGGESPLCDPGSELLLGGSARVVRG